MGIEDRLCCRRRRCLPVLPIGFIDFGQIGIPNLSTGREPSIKEDPLSPSSFVGDRSGGKSKETDLLGDDLSCFFFPVLFGLELGADERAGRIGIPNLSRAPDGPDSATVECETGDIGRDDRRMLRRRLVAEFA